MLVIINFDEIDEDLNKALEKMLDDAPGVNAYRRFLDNNYMVDYAAPEEDLHALYTLCKETLANEGDVPGFVINPLHYDMFRGWLPKNVRDFIEKHSSTPAAQDKKNPRKSKDSDLISPEAYLLKEDVSLESLMLDKETEKAVQAVLLRMQFQIAATKANVKLPEAYQNVLISGMPGVGKSTLSKAFALALREHLPKGKETPVYFLKPSDLIGAYRGHTQNKTQILLNEAENGIVILDEIDTCLDDAEATPLLNTLNTHMGDKPNWPIIIGTLYERNKSRFLNFNPGFQRRFTNSLHMESPDNDRLSEILLNRIKNAGLTYEPEAIAHMKELIQNARRIQKQNFGNIGEVNNILDMALKKYGRKIWKES